MAQSAERLRSIIESMLLVSAEPLPMARIVEVIEGEDPGTDPSSVRTAVAALIDAYGDPERGLGRGFRVEEVAGGIQLRSTPENAQYLRRLLAVRPQKLTRAALETLAIIAYRQPVTKPEVEAIRGVDIGAVLKALLERDLIRILGKKEEVGRPIMYGTTRRFLELFGLKSLSALPTLREYHELDEVHQQQVDALYEEDRPILSDLASTVDFLVEREHDPDLDALDEALVRTEHAGKATEKVLGVPTPKVEGGATPNVEGGEGESA